MITKKKRQDMFSNLKMRLKKRNNIFSTIMSKVLTLIKKKKKTIASLDYNVQTTTYHTLCLKI